VRPACAPAPGCALPRTHPELGRGPLTEVTPTVVADHRVGTQIADYGRLTSRNGGAARGHILPAYARPRGPSHSALIRERVIRAPDGKAEHGQRWLGSPRLSGSALDAAGSSGHVPLWSPASRLLPGSDAMCKPLVYCWRISLPIELHVNFAAVLHSPEPGGGTPRSRPARQSTVRPGSAARGTAPAGRVRARGSDAT
jgi:hypothetical protein